MTYIQSIRGVFTQHINKEYKSIAKTNFKRQPGKIVQQNQLFLIQFKGTTEQNIFRRQEKS